MSAPRVAYVTAGGAGMFCGSCMRDNALAAALIAEGVPITLVPTFTPIRTDEADVSEGRVYLGGINVYLEQRWPVLGRLPRPLRRLLDSPALLRAVSRRSLQRRRDVDAAVAVSLLRGEHGRQAAEIRDLVTFVTDTLEADVVNLTNLLIAGFVPSLKRRRDVPVAVTLQGDDVFLDALDPAGRDAVLAEMRRVARHVDAFVVFNEFYRGAMATLLDVSPDRFHVVPLGIADPAAFRSATPDRPPGDGPSVGYLARICPEKGFHVAVDAFLRLRERPGMSRARLRAAGWLGAGDVPFYERQLARLAAAGARFERVELPDRDAKIRFLRGIDVFTVPTVYEEPKGIPVLEALAAGVPVVQPAHGAFPELLRSTGGGRLVPPGDADALVDALHALLADPAERGRLGDEGRRGVAARHDARAMARRTLDVWRGLVLRPGLVSG